MDRNSWLGMVLIVGVMVAWGYFTKPTEQEIEKKRQEQIEAQEARKEKALKEIQLTDEASQNATIGVTEEKTNEELAGELQQLYGSFADFSQGEREFTTVESNLLKIQFLNQGGRIYSVELKDYKTHDGKPLILFSGDSTEFGLNFFAQNRNISTNRLFFTLSTDSEVFTEVINKPLTVKYTLPFSDGSSIEYKYVISPDSYQVDFDIQFERVNNLVSATTGYISLDWKSYIKG
jgi:YidC/Oxa1 family membrane protein insertase